MRSYLYHTGVDVDECKVNEGGCSNKARCINTPGSYYCRCKRGYVGDGFTCFQMDNNVQMDIRGKVYRSRSAKRDDNRLDSSDGSGVAEDSDVKGRCKRGFVRYGRSCKGDIMKIQIVLCVYNE